MKQLLPLLFLSLSASAQFNIKAGVAVPIPFYVPNPYTVHPSSALLTSSYTLKKWDIKATTGYLRFIPNSPDFGIAANIPLVFGASYHISPTFYVGLQAGPSIFTEQKIDDYGIKWLYAPHLGWKQKRWTLDLHYLNWEEVPDELNSMILTISYNLKK